MMNVKITSRREESNLGVYARHHSGTPRVTLHGPHTGSVVVSDSHDMKRIKGINVM